jgi:hypothetical protein
LDSWWRFSPKGSLPVSWNERRARLGRMPGAQHEEEAR